MSEEIEFETIEIDSEELPTKYLALCEILAEITGTTIIEVDDSVNKYIDSNHFRIEESKLPPKEELH
jgi:hypothetical protein